MTFTAEIIERTEPSEYEDKIAEKILDAAFVVHRELGPGLLENAYEVCLCDVLEEYGLKFEKQKIIPLTFRGKKLDAGFRADLIVENAVLIELKSVEKLISLHEAQLLTYLKLSSLRLGFLMNFNSRLLKDGLKRVILSQKS